jgi:tetratricopeptide (TPR) repeat protein
MIWNSKLTKKYIVLTGVGLITLAGGLTASKEAKAQGDHPRYLHALSDLRTARAYLARPDEHNVVADEMRAARAIDDSIEQIKRAAIADGKDLSDRPHIDVMLGHHDRLKRAIELLESAKRDLRGDEANFEARGWRYRAFKDVDDALKAANIAVRDDFRDDHAPAFGHHPYYIHALSDLRMARALLNRSEELDVNSDQKNAVFELNEAIGQIRRAAIMDGKDPDDHPKIDTSLDRRGRIQKAIELIRKAKSDILTREDNGRDIPWRNHAVVNLDNAVEASRKAIRDYRRDERRFDR